MNKSWLYMLLGALLLLLLPGCGVVAVSQLPIVVAVAAALIFMRLARGLVKWLLLGFVFAWAVINTLPKIAADLLRNFGGGRTAPVDA